MTLPSAASDANGQGHVRLTQSEHHKPPAQPRVAVSLESKVRAGAAEHNKHEGTPNSVRLQRLCTQRSESVGQGHSTLEVWGNSETIWCSRGKSRT